MPNLKFQLLQKKSKNELNSGAVHVSVGNDRSGSSRMSKTVSALGVESGRRSDEEGIDSA
jgi:hypothetical protein